MSLERLREQVEAEVAQLFPDALAVDVLVRVVLPPAEEFVRITIVPATGATS